MNIKPCIYDSHVNFRTTSEVKDLFYKAQKADKKRLNNALIKVCKYILDNPTNDDNNTSANVKEEEKPIIVTTATTIKKGPTKEELDELVRDIQVDDKEHKPISLREKINSIKSSSKHPVAFQNKEE